MKKPAKDVIRRNWAVDDLLIVWDFCQHDFARFIKMLVWIEKTF